MHQDIATTAHHARRAPSSARLLGQASRRQFARVLHPVSCMLRSGLSVRIQGIAQALDWPLAESLPQARQIYRGRFVLAGHEVEAGGRIVFDITDAPAAWLRELHALGWLRALLQAPGALMPMAALAHVHDWAQRARRGQLPAIASEPMVRARRVMHLCAAAPALLELGDEALRGALFSALAADVRQLPAAAAQASEAFGRLMAVAAQVCAALALQGLQGQREAALQALAGELKEQFLADGGHVSRNPLKLAQALAVLLPIARGLEQAGLSQPLALQQTIGRGLAMLRFFRHADGGLALFHGAGSAARGLVQGLLDMEAGAASPLALAPHSGYARLAANGAVALMDAGTPADVWHNPQAALSSLALEFSANGQRIITSCGAPWRDVPKLAQAARISAAHSLPQIADEDAGMLIDSELLQRFGMARPAVGPEVHASLQETEDGVIAQGWHDAWAAKHGLLVRRRLHLSADGRALSGEDVFEPAQGRQVAGVPFVIRFHLHPAVSASVARDGRTVALKLANGEGWQMKVHGADVALEESVLLADPAMPRASRQVVLSGVCKEDGARICWRLEQVAGAARQRRRQQRGSSPALPLEQQTGEEEA